MCLYNVATYGLAAGGRRYCTKVSYFHDKVFFRFAPSVTYQQLASLHSGPRACYLSHLSRPSPEAVCRQELHMPRVLPTYAPQASFYPTHLGFLFSRFVLLQSVGGREPLTHMRGYCYGRH